MRTVGSWHRLAIATAVAGAIGLAACSHATSDAAPPPPGGQIAIDHGCVSCHSIDGSRGVGPSWKGLYGSEVELVDGRRVVADDDYLRRAIREPSRDLVAGFSAGMPASALDDQEVTRLVAYIRSLGSLPAAGTSTP